MNTNVIFTPQKDEIPQIKVIFHFFLRGEIKNNVSEFSNYKTIFLKLEESLKVAQNIASPFLGRGKIKKGNFWGNFG
jgi:hypothetical protein